MFGKHKGDTMPDQTQSMGDSRAYALALFMLTPFFVRHVHKTAIRNRPG